jgi:hypothetical protein
MIHNISVMMWLVAPYSPNSDHGVNGQGDEEMCADRAERTNDLARFFAGRITNKPLRLNQLAYRHLRMLSILMKAQGEDRRWPFQGNYLTFAERLDAQVDFGKMELSADPRDYAGSRSAQAGMLVRGSPIPMKPLKAIIQKRNSREYA